MVAGQHHSFPFIGVNPVGDHGYGDRSASVDNLLPHKKSVLRVRPLDSKVMAASMISSTCSLNYAPQFLIWDLSRWMNFPKNDEG